MAHDVLTFNFSHLSMIYSPYKTEILSITPFFSFHSIVWITSQYLSVSINLSIWFLCHNPEIFHYHPGVKNLPVIFYVTLVIISYCGFGTVNEGRAFKFTLNKAKGSKSQVWWPSHHFQRFQFNQSGVTAQMILKYLMIKTPKIEHRIQAK